MIVKGLLELIYGLLQVIFSAIRLPAFPASIQGIVDEFISVLTGAVGLLGVFVDIDVVKLLIPLVLVIANFEKVYDLIVYILKKIPFIGIQ